jgi:hypothetical protein
MRTPKTVGSPKGLNHWIITTDFIADNEAVTAGVACNQHAVGMRSNHCGVPSGFIDELTMLANMGTPADAAKRVGAAAGLLGMTQLFRIYDDDSVLYYEGYMMPFDTHDERADGFEPLDDFAAPNAGATELRYWTQGKGWETL